MAVVVPLDRFADVMARFNDRQIEEYKAAVINALLKALPRLAQSSPVDTGLYAQSWDLILTEKTAILGNYAPHAPIIEYGARPHVPPIGPLVSWARRVLRTQVGADELEKAAWALAKHTQAKIAEEGQEPKFVLTNQLDLIIKDIERNMKESVSDWFK